MKTKKIKVRAEHLAEFRNHTQHLGRELKAVKITAEQAFSFNGEDMPEGTPLREGEYYNGYLAVKRGVLKPTLAYLNGSLQRMSPITASCTDSRYLDFLRNGEMWICLYPHRDKVIIGTFTEVYSLNAAPLIREAKFLNLPNPEALEASLKKKILRSLITDDFVELTEEEHMVLKRHLSFPLLYCLAYEEFICEK